MEPFTPQIPPFTSTPPGAVSTAPDGRFDAPSPEQTLLNVRALLNAERVEAAAGKGEAGRRVTPLTMINIPFVGFRGSEVLRLRAARCHAASVNCSLLSEGRRPRRLHDVSVVRGDWAGFKRTPDC